jgi:hypothetical protein
MPTPGNWEKQMLDSSEMQKLKAASLKLPQTTVQEEEDYVTRDPVLILMSTVLSLNRRWYSHALPARQYFEQKVYPSLVPKTLDGLRAFIFRAGSNRDDWRSVALALWNRREWGKARMLSELADYFVGWHQKNIPAASEIEALQKWASSESKDDFVGEIKGLGPRAHEQLLWYLDGKQAIKFDRHVASFVSQAVGRIATDAEAIQALRQIASEIGIAATALDVRIWDYMQSRCSA